MSRLREQRCEPRPPVRFEPWADPVEDDRRRARGVASHREVHGGKDPGPASTALRGRAYLDYLHGEIWTRQAHLTRRDRRIVSICCSAAVGVDEETVEHLRAALDTGDLGFDELQELVVHYAVYLGWPLGRRLDDLLVSAAGQTMFASLAESDEPREGMQAFMEKRPPPMGPARRPPKPVASPAPPSTAHQR